MILRADLHTHTLASRDAYSGNHTTATREELARAAAEAGIELLVVSDHGPACPGAQTVELLAASLHEPVSVHGVMMLSGVEADPVPGTDNGLDVPDVLLARLDFVTIGFHPYIGYDDLSPAEMTEVLVRAIANPNVDMICHPGNSWFPVDIEAVLEAASCHDVIVELNAHSFREGSVRADSVARETEFAAAARDHEVVLALNSDAHHAQHVGDVGPGLRVAQALGIDEDRFVNRDASAVLELLAAKRPRPRLDAAAERGEIAW